MFRYSHPKWFYFQNAAAILIIVRPFISDLIPLLYYVFILFGLFIVAYFKDGFTPKCLTYILSSFILILSEITTYYWVSYIGVILTIIPFLWKDGVRHYPQPTFLIGIKQDVIANQYYSWQLFPVENNPQTIENYYQITWGRQHEMNLWIEKYNSTLLAKILVPICMSFLNRQIMPFAKGDQKIIKGTIIFSLGRGGNTNHYSLYMRGLAQQHKLFTIKHKQILRAQVTEPTKVKQFRQKQNKQRAAQLYQLYKQKCINQDKIILIGHSYGGSTVIQLYHDMKKLGLQNKIDKLILQDPWLFPISQLDFNTKIKVPTYVIIHETYVKDRDIYSDIKRFEKIQNPISIWLKNTTHFDLLDTQVIVGNYFRVPNYKISFDNGDIYREVSIKVAKKCMQNATGQELQQIFKKYTLKQSDMESVEKGEYTFK